MNSAQPEIILYGYAASPYTVKVDNILLLKQIPYRRVNVANVVDARPEISQALGIGYRRIPICAIGNDVYCDTSLIASALERRFPAARGFGTLFPNRKGSPRADPGLVKAVSKHWVDVIFPLAPALLPWERFPAAFVEDRSNLAGSKIRPEAIAANRSKAISSLAAHLNLVEEQLSDGRQWLLDTETPSLADISVHFVYAWTKSLPGSKELFDEQAFPNTLKWLETVTAKLEQLKGSMPPPQKINAADAAAIIAAASFEPVHVVGFDEREAARLGLKAGIQVSVTPDDSGRAHPTVGKLIALSREEFVLEVKAAGGPLHCHFPRVMFTAVPAQRSKL
ncbi:Glutathione S-transferase [Mycena chlorophos]|uniref:Glutathione S-transferase n=1 Tax=Mycena chlorophos TaxID=658473 RepID=A0A8H6WG98_MYCCL|nr:Glutathione S-transferase [Mycena chlorophos]